MRRLPFVVLTVSVAVAVRAAVHTEKIMLWPDGKMPSAQACQHVPYLVWHTPEELKTKAVLIAVSGGGYGGNSIDGFEVVPMRDYMLAKGMTVVTLLYRTPRPRGLPKHMTAWQDAQRAVRLVRKLAKERGLDSDSIGFTGCSAGGHLAVMSAVSSQTSAYAPIDDLDAVPCNLNWAIPVYPAYVLADGIDGANANKGNDLTLSFAPEFRFDAATPPMCLFHGDGDGFSAMGSVRLYHKLREMGVAVELHVLALEDHCFQANPRSGTPAEIWKDIVWAWLVSIDAVTGHPMSWQSGWMTPILPKWAGKELSECADFEPAAWEMGGLCGMVLTPKRDSMLWLKGDWMDFELDFEYALDRAAKSGVVVRASDIRNWSSGSFEIPLLETIPGKWNRMTILVRGRRIRVTVNGKVTDDRDIPSRSDGRPHGAIGFRGKRGVSGPCFRNIRIRK